MKIVGCLLVTWKDYIHTIRDADLVKDSEPKIICHLFNKAKCKYGCSESAAKRWLDGSRNCQANRYFPDNKLNDAQALFRFFRQRPESKLKKVQDVFKEMADTDSSIDIETDDMDSFCWSLVNQFVDLLGFQRLDITHADMASDGLSPEDYLSKDKPMGQPTKESQQSLSPESIYSNFISAVKGFPIEKFLNNDPIASLPDYLVWDAITFWGSINASREADNAPGGTTDGYQRIIEFIDALKDYLDFLKENSVRRDAFPDDFHLISNGRVESKANTYRKRAKDLFKAAYLAAEIEQEQNRKQDSERLFLVGEKPPPHPGEYFQP